MRGVDLDVSTGELVAVMGPSGCGKSTLLHLLGGLDRPTAGSIALGELRVESLGEVAWAVLRRREIGFVDTGESSATVVSPHCFGWRCDVGRLTVKLAFSVIRRRRAQSVLSVVVVAVSAGALTIALAIGTVADRPFDRTFEVTNGAHVTMTSLPGGDRLGALARLPSSTASGSAQRS